MSGELYFRLGVVLLVVGGLTLAGLAFTLQHSAPAPVLQARRPTAETPAEGMARAIRIGLSILSQKPQTPKIVMSEKIAVLQLQRVEGRAHPV